MFVYGCVYGGFIGCVIRILPQELPDVEANEWAELSLTFFELQINELVDIALCIADTNESHPKAAEFIVLCMEDLKDVLQQNTVDALTVDTFGRRIDKLCRLALFN